MTMNRYHLELGAALAAYAALLVGANLLGGWPHPAGAGRLALAVLPMLGTVAVAWVVLRGIRRLDELQRRVQLEALALAFAGTALITFGWGFLEDAGLPRFPTFGVWPLMAVLWVLGLTVVARRYR